MGLGWIGLDRLRAIVEEGVGEVVALCDPSRDALMRGTALAPEAQVVRDLDQLVSLDLDGVVIATPSALHVEQAVAALDCRLAVFCQKPLGRDAGEVQRVITAARRADRRLGVDLAYRYTRALDQVRAGVAERKIGRVYAADLVFHNAYGPDRAWYRDRKLSGGGCGIDLGVHLVDAALWVLGFPPVERVRATRWAGGARLRPTDPTNEDHLVAEIELAEGRVARIACSWWLPAGRNAEITADFWGTDGALRFRNLDGSFYDFVAEWCRGTSTERLTGPPDPWNGRAAVRWARALATDPQFDSEIERQVEVARVLDAFYK